MNKYDGLVYLRELGFNVPTFTSNIDMVKLDPKSCINDILDSGHMARIITDNTNDNIEKISIRSSPKVSMPGVLETVINVDPRNFEDVRIAYKKVLDSYSSRISYLYRKRNGIDAETHPLIIIQEFIDTTNNNESGSGIIYNRNPDSGNPEKVIVFKRGSYGEDVASGGKSDDLCSNIDDAALKVASDIISIHMGFPQDIEFSILDGKIWYLQTRDMVFAKSIRNKALMNIYQTTPNPSKRLISRLPKFSDINPEDYMEVTSGNEILQLEKLVSGIGSGMIVDENSIVPDEPFIMVNEKLILNEMVNYNECKGIITNEGNQLCHAAIIARKYGIPCIIDDKKELWGKIGEIVTIDGNDGKVYSGIASTAPSKEYYDLINILEKV